MKIDLAERLQGSTQPSKDYRYYPKLRLNANKSEQIAKKRVGQHCVVVMELVKVGEEEEQVGKEKHRTMTLEMRSMEVPEQDILKEMGYRAKY